MKIVIYIIERLCGLWRSSRISTVATVWHPCTVTLLVSQETILLDPMFDVPGSDIIEVIINELVVNRKQPAEYIKQPPDGVFSLEERSVSNV